MARENGPIAVCVINLKGGVGKSTITTLLARRAFRTKRLDVLAIDLDPQANLSQALMGNDYDDFLKEKRPSIVEIFNDYQPASRTRSSTSSLDPTEAVEGIASFGDISLQLIPSRFDFSDNLTSSIKPDPKVLARFLAQNFSHKDLILIDCSPTESILTQAAYHASGLILVPVKPEYFATIGFPLLKQSIDSFKSRNRGHHIEVSGIVINNSFYDGGNNGGPEKLRAMEEIEEEATKNEWHIFETELEFSRGYPKLMRGDYNFPGNAARFWRFADEFFTTVGL